MKRTRRWEFVKQDAIRLATLGLSDLEIGQRLDLNRATVYRWRKAGKLTVESASPVGRLGVERLDQTPAQWAANVRAEFDLDATDDQILRMAEAVAVIARDPHADAKLRLAAMREFRGAVKQLALVTRATQPADAPTPEAPKRQTFQAPKRTGTDPRAMFVVK